MSALRLYKLKIEEPIEKPHWHFDPATNRQLKVLSFFGVETSDQLAKGKASGIIGALFRTEANKELWGKYVYSTGDESDDSSDLQPFDLESLKNVVVPEDWSPARTPREKGPSSKQKRMRALVVDILREGSPFDEPVPNLEFKGRYFAFTGKFSSGTRQECQDSVKELGAIPQDKVNLSTDYLVIGSKGSTHWAEGSHGRKIEKAMIQRMEKGKPWIIAEADWITFLQKG